MPTAPYRLNPVLDVARIASDFASAGRVQIADFLVREDAERLLASLRAASDWSLIVNHGDKIFRLKRADHEALTQAQKDTLVGAVHDGARHGFQYMFETIQLPDGGEGRAADNSELARFVRFLSSEPLIALFRKVSGKADIAFADAQATAYSPGHFLTAHDDAVEGKNRRIAYVMNLTAGWRIEWGGMLMFHKDEALVEEAWAPTFNVLNLFAVPRAHSVSIVAPFAGRRRYSVTGWLRAR